MCASCEHACRCVPLCVGFMVCMRNCTDVHVCAHVCMRVHESLCVKFVYLSRCMCA